MCMVLRSLSRLQFSSVRHHQTGKKRLRSWCEKKRNTPPFLLRLLSLRFFVARALRLSRLRDRVACLLDRPLRLVFILTIYYRKFHTRLIESDYPPILVALSVLTTESVLRTRAVPGYLI